MYIFRTYKPLLEEPIIPYNLQPNYARDRPPIPYNLETDYTRDKPTVPEKPWDFRISIDIFLARKFRGTTVKISVVTSGN